ncbi:hypothetical protein evm_003298 [Chilo suppressalis]|nr:hypothetical protein evm_003298 [Chilo suppressalis]
MGGGTVGTRSRIQRPRAGLPAHVCGVPVIPRETPAVEPRRGREAAGGGAVVESLTGTPRLRTKQCRRHYSLKTNELLKCHWAKYKREYGDRVFAPFQFLDIRDYHFYNCRNRLLPAESIHTKKEFRFKLKPGPGVDHMGQMPIPQELHVKRGVDRPKLFKKRNNKNDGYKIKDNGIKEKSAENNN